HTRFSRDWSSDVCSSDLLEHHFNGLLTNKIPLLNQLKWNLVAGANAFYVNSDNNYVEVFAGLENIFKLIRVDVIAGYQSQDATQIGRASCREIVEVYG